MQPPLEIPSRQLGPSLIRLGPNSSRRASRRVQKICILQSSLAQARLTRFFHRFPSPRTLGLEMAVSQAALREIWLGGRPDRLCLLQVAKAWALREVSRELHDGQDHLPWVAGRVFKNDGTNPGRDALRQLFEKIDNDPDWFPGKQHGEKRGRPPLFTPAKRSRCSCKLVGGPGHGRAGSHAVCTGPQWCRFVVFPDSN